MRHLSSHNSKAPATTKKTHALSLNPFLSRIGAANHGAAKRVQASIYMYKYHTIRGKQRHHYNIRASIYPNQYPPFFSLIGNFCAKKPRITGNCKQAMLTRVENLPFRAAAVAVAATNCDCRGPNSVRAVFRSVMDSPPHAVTFFFLFPAHVRTSSLAALVALAIS